MKKNLKLCLFAVVTASILSGCSNLPSRADMETGSADTFVLEAGSLRLQTQKFATKYGIETIAYHRAIDTQEDYQIIAKKTLNNPEGDLQQSLQIMFNGSPYIPVLNDRVLTIYPLTTTLTPLAGAPNVKNFVSTVPPRNVNDGTRTKISSEDQKSESTELTSTITPKGQSNADAAQPTKSSDKTSLEHADTGRKANLPASNSQSDALAKNRDGDELVQKELIKPVKQDGKTFTLYRGQSYRDSLQQWLDQYGVDRILYATGPDLTARLKKPSTENLQYDTKNVSDIFNLLNKKLSEESSRYAFKVRIVNYRNEKIAILHQHSSSDVSVFEVQQGSLKDNAFRLANYFDYKVLNDKESEYRSWGLDNDPRIQTTTLTVIPNNIRLAYGVLFKNYNAKALLLDSANTVLFVPRNKYEVKANDHL